MTVPVGASNEIGSLGYVNAMEEIFYQEKKLGVEFDLIALTVGSGGTYAGSIYGVNKYFKMNKDVLGFAVADNKKIFKEKIKGILQKMYEESNEESLDYNKIMLNDDYVGEGYGKPYDEELKFIKYLAKKEGIILDPVYTGKAFYGLCNMIKSGKLKNYKNILFIHTGGIFGWSEGEYHIYQGRYNSVGVARDTAVMTLHLDTNCAISGTTDGLSGGTLLNLYYAENGAIGAAEVGIVASVVAGSGVYYKGTYYSVGATINLTVRSPFFPFLSVQAPLSTASHPLLIL